MNYLEHYTQLVSRAKTRSLAIYTETHHIMPKCMGGLDTKDNLVELTPEEHYVAHQLLIKIYPENVNLVFAATMMTVGLTRRNNKRYGWLRRRHCEAAKATQTGDKNSQAGTVWIYHPETDVSKKIRSTSLDSYIAQGWIKARRLYKKICGLCDKEFLAKRASIKFCSKQCQNLNISNIAKQQLSCKSVICEDGTEFKSLSDAARFYSVNVETIRYRIACGKYKMK